MYQGTGISVFKFYSNGSVYFIGDNQLDFILHYSKDLRLSSWNYVFNNISCKFFPVLEFKELYLLLKYSEDFDLAALTFRAT